MHSNRPLVDHPYTTTHTRKHISSIHVSCAKNHMLLSNFIRTWDATDFALIVQLYFHFVFISKTIFNIKLTHKHTLSNPARDKWQETYKQYQSATEERYENDRFERISSIDWAEFTEIVKWNVTKKTSLYDDDDDMMMKHDVHLNVWWWVKLA